MEQLYNVLAIDHPDWTIPWAGLGALLLGVGGVLSGIAALITARNRGRDETISTTVSRSDDGRERRVPGGDANERSGDSSHENSNG